MLRQAERRGDRGLDPGSGIVLDQRKGTLAAIDPGRPEETARLRLGAHIREPSAVLGRSGLPGGLHGAELSEEDPVGCDAVASCPPDNAIEDAPHGGSVESGPAVKLEVPARFSRNREFLGLRQARRRDRGSRRVEAVLQRARGGWIGLHRQDGALHSTTHPGA